MPTLRLALSLTRFWRCYVLLLIASLLSLFLVFIGQNDPSLKIYFQYFQPYSYSKAEMVKLMEPNKLDYEFLNIDPRACYRHQQAAKTATTGQNDGQAAVVGQDVQQDVDEDYKLLNENYESPREAPRIKVLLLSISRSSNYKSRLAARQTWYKFMNKQDVKLMFVVGNPAYSDKRETSSNLFRALVGNADGKRLAKDPAKDAKRQEELNEIARLDKEIKDYGDIIQVNMPDDDNFTSTKTLFAIRWAITYCEIAQNLFILSDSSVVNHHLFDSLILNGLLGDAKSGATVTKVAPAWSKLSANTLNDSSIVGVCDQSDEKFANALREFIMELYKEKLRKNPKAEQRSPRSERAEENSTSRRRVMVGVRNRRDVTPVKTKAAQESTSTNKSVNPTLQTPREPYKGQYCSSLGWMVTLNGAKKLWSTALRTSYMMNRSPAYLNGYLAFKANLRQVSLFDYHEEVPEKLNCHKLIESEPKYLLCAENFTIDGRYTNYMASWNSVAQSQFNLAKL